jgi:hypothetical protein
MDINDLIKLLPEGYENACYKTKAMTRKRTIKNPKDKGGNRSRKGAHQKDGKEKTKKAER